ncbi:hypothetical protein NDU88_001008 [Pleurodeles waltl]|uniref:Uncharacterized protein n=1 Tax=Pleurodeles waltl TaxID=8319 RepID=A0AAV7Q4Q7_PLEWA|nr:hypothetical protein NDU88_001008 [Pleurodeles waltl]
MVSFRLDVLESEWRRRERMHNSEPDMADSADLNLKQEEFKDNEGKFLGNHAAPRTLEKGERRGRTLSRTICPAWAASDIVQIELKMSETLHSPPDILDKFTTF